MKIQKVRIKEFKALKNIDEEINGNNIILIGDNGVGKSSFIQFIEIALGKNTNIPPNAMGEGEVITDKNGNKYIFKVKLSDGKANVTVTCPDGVKSKLKSEIAAIVGAMEFDIFNFVELSKTPVGRKKQIETFKSFLPQEVIDQLKTFEDKVVEHFNERTEVNRALKEKEAAIKEHPLSSEIHFKVFAPVDVKDLYLKMESINESNNKIKDVASRMASRVDLIQEKTIELAEREIELEELQKKVADQKTALAELKTKNLEAENWLKKNVVADLMELQNQIKTASETNKAFEDSEKLKKDMALAEKLKEESGELTAKIESSREAIANAIREMDSPLEGLMFDDDQLVYNGIPVNPDSLSTSEIMELGVRLKMVENPDFGILFIQGGESLGAARLKEIQEMAEKAGWQIIMEQVERGVEKLQIEIMQL